MKADKIKLIRSKMIKLPLILISYIGIFFMSIFSLGEISIEHNLPAAIAPGQKKLVQLTIRKGDIKGFSKLEIPMPVGFNVTPGEIKGASFTFKGQSAKFIWMQLPEEANFTISYYLESSSTVNGIYDIGGTFSYVKDNRRQDIKLPLHHLIIKDASQIEEQPQLELASNETPQSVSPTTNEESTSIVENTSNEEIPLPATLSNVVIPTNIKREEEVADMICKREITRISDNEFNVKLIIENNSITGFGKILETLPEHCKTEKINDADAVVTQDKNTIKFVWFEIPTSKTVEVSYKVSCLKSMDILAINGQLSYTDNGNPIIVPVIQTEMTSTEAYAETTPLKTEEKQPESEDTVVKTIKNEELNDDKQSVISNTNKDNYAENNSKSTTVSDSNISASNNKVTSKTPVTTVPSAEIGVTYKVQILAAHRVVNKNYFETNFNFEDRFNIENHEGWVKYTTGNFTQYKQARDERERITSNHSKLPGPFVTAYNDGQRITVQEALLISNQQWFK